MTSELCFDSTVTHEHVETAIPDYACDIGAPSNPFRYPDDERPDLASALMRRYCGDDVAQWAARFVTSSGSIGTMPLLLAITRGIKEQLVCVRRSEKGVQSASETLRRGRGSCRDFALLIMEAVCSLDLAARFVSGYIFVPEVQPAIVSGGATHAWMQIYLPGAGWVDFDPTNSIVGNRNLIRVAVAWGVRESRDASARSRGPGHYTSFCYAKDKTSRPGFARGIPAARDGRMGTAPADSELMGSWLVCAIRLPS